MNQILNINSKYSAFMNKIIVFIVLNFIWVLSCIPIITAGAGTTAIYYCLMKYRLQGSLDLIKDFTDSFKRNFKQSTIAWLIYLIMGIILSLDYYVLFKTDFTYKFIFLILTSFVALTYLLSFIYFFPLLARFDNSNLNLLKFSIILGYKHISKSVLLIGIFAFEILLNSLSAILIPLWVIAGYTLVAYLNVMIYLSIFKHYEGENSNGIDIVN